MPISFSWERLILILIVLYGRLPHNPPLEDQSKRTTALNRRSLPADSYSLRPFLAFSIQLSGVAVAIASHVVGVAVLHSIRHVCFDPVSQSQLLHMILELVSIPHFSQAIRKLIDRGSLYEGVVLLSLVLLEIEPLLHPHWWWNLVRLGYHAV